ncbi:MAG: galactokinase [Deltaproteobacteria bacterium]|nr:galactokinase [Candidatus Zymogenaceae bacterium]
MDNNQYLMISAYGSYFAEIPHYFVTAPGRVNLIGEHTDYNDGFVLPIAIDRRIYATARPMYGDLVKAKSVGFDEMEEFHIREELKKRDLWVDYLMGVVDEMKKDSYDLNGFWVLFRSDVPIGSGLSSSAALEVASGLLISSLFEHDIDRLELAKIARRAEQNFVGVNCGIMDQMATLLCTEDHALFIDCRDQSHRQVPVAFSDAGFMVVDTKVKRKLDNSAYNERREQCEAAVKAVAKNKKGVTALRDAEISDLDGIAGNVDDVIIKRARHVISENERVKKAVAMLEKNDAEGFGKLMNESHESLKNDYQVSCDELDRVVEIAKETGGVLGARMTGAGFGGCVVALVKKGSEQTFADKITAAFAPEEPDSREPEEGKEADLPDPPEVFSVRPVGGATVEKLDIKS